MMKSIVNRIVLVLVVGALTSVAAFAKVQKHKVTFENDTQSWRYGGEERDVRSEV